MKVNKKVNKQGYLGDPPGTIKYTGMYNDIKVEIQGIIYDKDNLDIREVKSLDEISEKDKVCWINIVGLHDIKLIEEIGRKFGIHHMDLEDIVHVSQWSKIEKKDSYIFSIFKMIYIMNNDVVHEHISMVLKDNILITFQETPGDVFDSVRDRIKNNQGRIRNNDSNYLYYSLLDMLVDNYFEISSRVSKAFNDVEVSVLENIIDCNDKIYGLRKEVLYMVNAVTPIRDVIRNFIGENKNIIPETMVPYYWDLMEHLDQISESLKTYKEMTNSLYEMNMLNFSNDMNKTMMTLTIFSVIFIPLSFLAGVFGMNFSYIPGLSSDGAFYIFISSCIIIAGVMLGFFKKKKWF